MTTRHHPPKLPRREAYRVARRRQPDVQLTPSEPAANMRRPGRTAPRRQPRARPANHLTDPGQPRTALDQLHMRSGALTRQRHAEIINTKPPRVEPPLQLVQSTVQWGGATPKAGGKELDGREWCGFPELEPV